MNEHLSRDMVVYVLLRTDLPSMNPGKAAAQTHHAGVQMMGKHVKRQLVKDYVGDGIEHGADWFNTTVVLGATLDDIVQRKQAADLAGEHTVVVGTVTDPSYPFVVETMEIASLIPESTAKLVKQMPDGRVLMTREELTCAWFCGNRDHSSFRSLFDGLELYP
jgi:peptidyl-tRNA hydrolase